MFSQALKHVDSFVKNKHASAAIALIGYQDGVQALGAYGRLCFSPASNRTGTDALFDLASLTKVICTTTITLKLIELGALRLTTTLGEILPTAPPDKRSITVEQLLTHTGGLPAAYRLEQDPRFRHRETALEAALDAPLLHPIGAAVNYSCSGFIVLGLILERITQTPLEILFTQIVAEPLQLTDTGFNPGKEKINRIACTEWDQKRQDFWRGIVHDERARALGGVSGNAGLFGTAPELGAFCQMLLDQGSYPTRDNSAIFTLRPRFYQSICQAIDAR